MIQSKVIFLYDNKGRVRNLRPEISNYTVGKTYDVIISPERLNFQIQNDVGNLITMSHVLIDYGIFVEVHKFRDDKLNTILQNV
jgi:hypothetical protein